MLFKLLIELFKLLYEEYMKLIKKINNINPIIVSRKIAVKKKLEKDSRKVWKDDRVVYINGKIYISNNWKIQE